MIKNQRDTHRWDRNIILLRKQDMFNIIFKFIRKFMISKNSN